MVENTDVTEELTAELSTVARALFSAGDVRSTLQTVVNQATATIDGCDVASIFVADADRLSPPVSTESLAAEVDTLQRAAGQGPCLDATARGVPVYADDLTIDPRWPVFGPASAAAGIRCVLAFPLLASDAEGVLALSAAYPGAFGATDRAKGVIFATLADLALAGAQTHEEEDRRADNLNRALVTRELIGRAEGILMERERITSDQAFDILRRASQHLNVKLKEVAEDLVQTGERPVTGPGTPVQGSSTTPQR
jgi:GAF domain-containing protein